MHIANEITTHAPIRVGLVIAAGLVALIGAAVAVRPDMMAMGMSMVRGLVVGFGL